jgi:hypothetical protein
MPGVRAGHFFVVGFCPCSSRLTTALPPNAAAKGQATKKSNSRLTNNLAVSVVYFNFVQRVKNWILINCRTRKIVPIDNK